MTREELSTVSARFAGVHRAAFEVIGGMVQLAELDKVSKNSQELHEIIEAYQCTRIKLIEALQWQRTLHQMLMVRTVEGRAAAKEYQEKLEQLQKEAEEVAKNAPKEPEAMEAEPKESEEPPKLTLLPKIEGDANG